MMAKGKNMVVQDRRKRTGYTDRNKRLNLLKSGGHRLVVRRSDKYLLAQLVDYSPEGDKVLATVSSRELKSQGWKYSCKNLPAAYLTGLLVGKKTKGKVTKAIVDMGSFVSKKESRIYALVKGAIDSGLDVPVSDKVLPSEERLKGSHIASYRKGAEKITDDFEKMKSKING